MHVRSHAVVCVCMPRLFMFVYVWVYVWVLHREHFVITGVARLVALPLHLSAHKTHTAQTHTHTYIHSLFSCGISGQLPIRITEAWEWNWQSWAEGWHSRHKQPLPASMASLRGQWFGAAKWHSCNVLLEQFPHKYLHSSVVFFVRQCVHVCVCERACFAVWAMTISEMSVILRRKKKKKSRGRKRTFLTAKRHQVHYQTIILLCARSCFVCLFFHTNRVTKQEKQ